MHSTTLADFVLHNFRDRLVGLRVKTTRFLRRDREYMPEAIELRRAHHRQEGTIVMHHDAHGLCFDVEHADGALVPWEPDELTVIDLPKQWGIGKDGAR